MMEMIMVICNLIVTPIVNMTNICLQVIDKYPLEFLAVCVVVGIVTGAFNVVVYVVKR